MGGATRKLNFLIEEDISRDLEALVPTGQRSRVVNEALRKELELIRRRGALEGLQNVRTSGKRFSSRDIVEHLGNDSSAD
jgi:hypothetical protein